MTQLGMWKHYGRAVIRRTIRSEAGASLVEYVFLLTLIAVVCVVAITFFGTATRDNLDSSASRL